MMKYKIIQDSDEPDIVENVMESVIRDMRCDFYNNEYDHYDVRKSVLVGDRRIDARFTLDVTERVEQ